ncbi:MAG TPA: hypothetical protein VJH88_03860 [Candidatus Nanoarchaeia archaeon]|nr:hypothetical protein [Candidatus Nanoarchaeia archaeon]
MENPQSIVAQASEQDIAEACRIQQERIAAEYGSAVAQAHTIHGHDTHSIDDLVVGTLAMDQKLADALRAKVEAKKSELTQQRRFSFWGFFYSLFEELGARPFPQVTDEEATRAVCSELYDHLSISEGRLKAQRDRLEKGYADAVQMKAKAQTKYDQDMHTSAVLSRKHEELTAEIKSSRDAQMSYQRSHDEASARLFENHTKKLPLLQQHLPDLQIKQQELLHSIRLQQRDIPDLAASEESLQAHYENADIIYHNVRHTRKMLDGALHDSNGTGMSSYPLLTQALRQIAQAQTILEQTQSLVKPMASYLK